MRLGCSSRRQFCTVSATLCYCTVAARCNTYMSDPLAFCAQDDVDCPTRNPNTFVLSQKHSTTAHKTTPESNSLSNRNQRMALPIEAEFAVPPILSPELENHVLHAPIGDLVDDPDVQVTLSPSTTITPSIHAQTRDVEAGEKFTFVEFEPGTGENPKEWSKGHKW